MEAPLLVRVGRSVDGVTPLRALILQAYYALRRTRSPDVIGTPEIRAWIRAREPTVERPSGTLVRVTLLAAQVPHRKDGRPRRDTALRPDEAAPLLSTHPSSAWQRM